MIAVVCGIAHCLIDCRPCMMRTLRSPRCNFDTYVLCSPVRTTGRNINPHAKKAQISSPKSAFSISLPVEQAFRQGRRRPPKADGGLEFSLFPARCKVTFLTLEFFLVLNWERETF